MSMIKLQSRKTGYKLARTGSPLEQMNRGCQSPKVKRYNRVADAIESDQLSNKLSKGSNYDETSIDARGRKSVRS